MLRLVTSPSLLVELLPTELWAAFAQVRGERDRRGDAWPPAAWIAECAARHDTCPWALLALTRAELPEVNGRPHEFTGRLASLFGGPTVYVRPVVLAPTPDTLTVLHLTADRLYVDVLDPWGRAVDRRDLGRACADWHEATHERHGTRLAPARIATPALPGQPEAH